MKDALTAHDSQITNKVLAITFQDLVVVIKGRPSKKAVLVSLRQEVTAEETSAAMVMPDITRTTVTSIMFHQIHLLVLAIHTLLANIHTKILGPAPLGIME